MRKFTRSAVQWCAQHGVAPIELFIVVLVLGVLASLIVPPFTTAAPDLRSTSDTDRSLRDTLQYVRTQITVFKAQHREVPPGYPDGNIQKKPEGACFAAQLTEYSDCACHLSPTSSGDYPLGKYLDRMPSNPFNGSTAVWVESPDHPAPDSDKIGWIYNPRTLDFRINSTAFDAQGIAYSAY